MNGFSFPSCPIISKKFFGEIKSKAISGFDWEAMDAKIYLAKHRFHIRLYWVHRYRYLSSCHHCFRYPALVSLSEELGWNRWLIKRRRTLRLHYRTTMPYVQLKQDGSAYVNIPVGTNNSLILLTAIDASMPMFPGDELLTRSFINYYIKRYILNTEYKRL